MFGYGLAFAVGVEATCLYVVALLVLRDRRERRERETPPDDGLIRGAPVDWQERLDEWRALQHTGGPSDPSDSDSGAF